MNNNTHNLRHQSLEDLIAAVVDRTVRAAMRDWQTQADANGYGQLLVPVVDAAEMLGVGKDTVYDLIELGELDTVDIGRGIKVTTESLRQYVESHKQRAGRPVSEIRSGS